MPALDHLDWPFFDDAHRALGRQLWSDSAAWFRNTPVADIDTACRQLVRALGDRGVLRHCVPKEFGGVRERVDSRSLCLVREILAYHEGLADFAFAMQGLGSGAITLAGSDEQQRSILPRVAAGNAIMAFALSEPGAGSDVGAMTCSARRAGAAWVINGDKTWISNGGIADFYTVFARSDAKATGSKGISAFIVPADTPGLRIAERIDVIAPHPLARLAFEDCRVPATSLLGVEGEGFKLALATLDIFRASVAAAALGFARRALDEALAHARARAMFGAHLADLPVAQTKLADMATAIDAAALLTYRAAWVRDVQGQRATREAAMAKMTATESAQNVIDDAVQLFGGLGVKKGSIVERLYREIRSLRIYEGATEVQKLVIARELLKS